MSGSDHHPDHGPARVVLAVRRNAGIQVTLLWAADTDAVAVRVRNHETDDRFELAVEPGTNALDVYEHPYAYAARRGIPYQAGAAKAA
jgi:hypothetical protein